MVFELFKNKLKERGRWLIRKFWMMILSAIFFEREDCRASPFRPYSAACFSACCVLKPLVTSVSKCSSTLWDVRVHTASIYS